MPRFLKGFMTTFIPGIIVFCLVAFALPGRSDAGQTSRYPNLKLYAQYVEDPNGNDSAYLMVFTMPNGHKLVCIDSTSTECNFDQFNKESNNG